MACFQETNIMSINTREKYDNEYSYDLHFQHHGQVQYCFFPIRIYVHDGWTYVNIKIFSFVVEISLWPDWKIQWELI